MSDRQTMEELIRAAEGAPPEQNGLQARDGRPVWIYAVHDVGAAPVHGAILNEGGWQVTSWCVSGNYFLGHGGPHRMDLIPIPRPPREWWVNEYKDWSGGVLHDTQKDADLCAGQDRIRCFKVREVIK